MVCWQRIWLGVQDFIPFKCKPFFSPSKGYSIQSGLKQISLRWIVYYVSIAGWLENLIFAAKLSKLKLSHPETKVWRISTHAVWCLKWWKATMDVYLGSWGSTSVTQQPRMIGALVRCCPATATQKFWALARQATLGLWWKVHSRPAVKGLVGAQILQERFILKAMYWLSRCFGSCWVGWVTMTLEWSWICWDKGIPTKHHWNVTWKLNMSMSCHANHFQVRSLMSRGHSTDTKTSKVQNRWASHPIEIDILYIDIMYIYIYTYKYVFYTYFHTRACTRTMWAMLLLLLLGLYREASGSWSAAMANPVKAPAVIHESHGSVTGEGTQVDRMSRAVDSRDMSFVNFRFFLVSLVSLQPSGHIYHMRLDHLPHVTFWPRWEGHDVMSFDCNSRRYHFSCWILDFGKFFSLVND